MTILLVQAGGRNSGKLEAELRTQGYEVETTNNPAWRLNGHGLCLVCVGDDVEQAAAAIGGVRAIQQGRAPLLACGPPAAAAGLRELIQAGADDFLAYPCEAEQLRMRLLIWESRAARRLPGGGAGEELEQAHADQVLAGLIGRIVHDYNNLLAAIQGNAELSLLSPRIDPATRHGLEQIRRAAEKAVSLTHQIQAFAKGKHGVVTRLPLDLSALVRDSAELLRVAVSRGCRLKYELEDGLPLISGDSGRLRQALAALAINASEAMGEDGGEVTVRTWAQGGFAVMEVEDTGPGIDPELRERVFDPFFSTKEAGRGLGLAAVQAIAKAHGAGIELSGWPGTKVRMKFPEAAPASSSVAECAAKGALLLIDDEDGMRLAAHRHLRRAGYVVFEAETGSEALEVMRQVAPALDAVVVDPATAEVDGGLMLRELRALRGDLRIVIWSAAPEAEARAAMGDGGALAFANKKTGVADLDAALLRVRVRG